MQLTKYLLVCRDYTIESLKKKLVEFVLILYNITSHYIHINYK